MTKVIKPRKWLHIDFAELWQFRELAFFLTSRDIKIRYKQSVLGILWAIIQPVATMLVFSILFGALMGRENKPTIEGIPYAISTFAALVPWRLYAFSIGNAGNSLVANRNMITKTYFPRLLIPMSSVMAGVADFLLAFVVLAAMMVWYGLMPGWEIFMLPVFSLLAVVTIFSFSLWLSALNAVYRDVKYVVPFMTQVLMFVTPVVYPAKKVMGSMPEWAQVIYSLNPMFSVVEGFRWCLLSNAAEKIRADTVPDVAGTQQALVETQARLNEAQATLAASPDSAEAAREFAQLTQQASAAATEYAAALAPATDPVISFDSTYMILSSAMVVVLLISGLYYFRRMETKFADVI